MTLHSDSVWEGTKEPLGLWDDKEVRGEHQNLHRTQKNDLRGGEKSSGTFSGKCESGLLLEQLTSGSGVEHLTITETFFYLVP